MRSIKTRERVVLDCIEYMKKMHDGQFRRGNNAPFYTHPLRVLELLEEAPFFFSARDKCAALLHDVKEDSPLFSWEEIVERFSPWVAGVVALLSKTKLGETQPEVYFHMLRHTHPNIIAVKLCDRISNTEDYNIVMDAVWLEKYLSETIELVHPLIQLMVARGSLMAPQGYYELGVWLEGKLQHNLHGMQTRLRELKIDEDIKTDIKETSKTRDLMKLKSPEEGKG